MGVMKNKCIIIIGSMRSGSSLAARIFHQFGVFLTDTPAKYDPTNVEGEYENEEITALNESILRKYGGGWNYPIMVTESQEECKQIIEKYTKPIWGWKDNRTVFTFRCYEQFLLDQDVLFVVVHRDKDAVVKSHLASRNEQFLDKDKNAKYMGKLYDMYYNSINEVTKGYNRIDVHYEDLAKYNRFFNPNLKHF